MTDPKALSNRTDLATRLRQAKEQLQDIRNEVPIAVDEKDNSGSKASKKNNKVSRQKMTIAKNTKLFVAGRFDRQTHSYTSKAFYILDDLDDDIKTYCTGSDIAIYNFLISIGLEQIKKLTAPTTYDVSEIEQKYNDKKQPTE